MSPSSRLERQQAMAEMLAAFEDAAALIDSDGSVIAHNRAWRAHRFSEAVFSDGDPIPVARVLAGEVDHVAGAGRRVSRDGWRWYRSRVRRVGSVDGAAAVLTHRDITDERRLQSRMATSPVAHLELDRDGTLLSVNEAWEQIRGRPVGAELGMRWIRDTREPNRSDLLELLQTPQSFQFDLTTIGGDDRSRVVALAFQPAFDGDEWFGWHAVATDQTDRRELESAAAHAFADSLTGCPNRWLFEATTARALDRRAERPQAVLFIDLDRFKPVNDAFGHGFGDVVLRMAAARISGVFRPADLVARHGGDEFVVLLEDVDAEAVKFVGERLVDAFAAPFRHEDREIDLGVSVGIAFRRPGDNVESIVRRADRAMYEAKSTGGRRSMIADG